MYNKEYHRQYYLRNKKRIKQRYLISKKKCPYCNGKMTKDVKRCHKCLLLKNNPAKRSKVREKLSRQKRGKLNPAWRGGITYDKKEYRRRRWEKNKEYYKKQFRKWYQANKERDKKRSYQWKRNNLERWRILKRLSNGKRKTQIRNTDNKTITPEEIEIELKAQNKKCVLCTQLLRDFHIDHIIPLSKGGEHKIENIQLLCPKCNIKKRDKILCVKQK